MYMPHFRSSWWPLLICIVLAGSCDRAKGPRGLSESTYVATQKAVVALELASRDRDANPSVFEPKMQTASKLAEEAFNEMGTRKADGYAVSQVRTCIDELKTYRSNFESRESVSRPIQEQLKGIKGAEMKDSIDVVARNSQALDDCLKSVKGYL